MLEWKICQLEIFTFGDNGQVALGHVDLVSGKWLGLIPGYLFRKTGTDSVYHADSEDTDILVEFTGNSIMKFLTHAILTPSKSKFWTVFRSQNSTYKYLMTSNNPE